MMRPYPITDSVFICSDEAGAVAAFVTAGCGSIPEAALEDTFPAIEYIEEQLCKLPYTSKAKIITKVPDPSSFGVLAKRGLFVYDWQFDTNAYAKVAVPTNPIQLNALPPDLEGFAKIFNLPMHFHLNDVINLRDYFKCL